MERQTLSVLIPLRWKLAALVGGAVLLLVCLIIAMAVGVDWLLTRLR